MSEQNRIELKKRLAEAYIPAQTYTQKYKLAEALNRGTLFPELTRPYQPDN